MAEIINLRLARKQRDRDRARDEGHANAAKFGRSKTEVARQDQIATRAKAHLDGAEMTKAEE